MPRLPIGLPNRRTFLRAAAVTGTLLPAGVLAQRLGRSPLPAELLDPAICRASFGEPIVLPQLQVLSLDIDPDAQVDSPELGAALARLRVPLVTSVSASFSRALVALLCANPSIQSLHVQPHSSPLAHATAGKIATWDKLGDAKEQQTRASLTSQLRAVKFARFGERHPRSVVKSPLVLGALSILLPIAPQLRVFLVTPDSLAAVQAVLREHKDETQPYRFCVRVYAPGSASTVGDEVSHFADDMPGVECLILPKTLQRHIKLTADPSVLIHAVPRSMSQPSSPSPSLADVEAQWAALRPTAAAHRAHIASVRAAAIAALMAAPAS